LRDEKEAVIEHDGQLNGNEPTNLGEGLSPSSDWVEEPILEVDLPVESKPIDYSNFDKKDFVGLLKEAAANNNFKRADELIREIKPLFDDIHSESGPKRLFASKKMEVSTKTLNTKAMNGIMLLIFT